MGLTVAADCRALRPPVTGIGQFLRGLLPALAAVGFDTVSLNTVLKNDNLDDVPAILELALRSGVRVGFSAYCALKTGDERLLVYLERHPRLEEFARDPASALFTLKVEKYVCAWSFRKITVVEMSNPRSEASDEP